MENIKIKQYLKGSIVCKKGQKITTGFLIIGGAVYSTEENVNLNFGNEDFYSAEGVSLEELIRRQGPHDQ